MTTALLAIAGIPILPILGLLACVVVFVVAFLRPIRSITTQHRIQAWLSRTRGATREHSPGDGHMAEKPVAGSQKAIDKAAGAGRNLRSRLPF